MLGDTAEADKHQPAAKAGTKVKVKAKVRMPAVLRPNHPKYPIAAKAEVKVCPAPDPEPPPTIPELVSTAPRERAKVKQKVQVRERG